MLAPQTGIAVVTGAAGGLGSAFARQLAERGYRLLLVDRRQGPLEQLCESITAKQGVSAEPYVADFGQREEVQRLAQRLAQTTELEVLVNNAGFGTTGYFADTDAGFLLSMVDVHIAAPTILTRAALPGLLERDRGNIINVSSVGGFIHCAGNAQYGATKNYLAVFAQSLHDELRGTNVRVQALCPGYVRTQFHGAETMVGYDPRQSPKDSWWMTPDEVVAYSLKQMHGKQAVVVPGLGYRIVCRLARMPVAHPIIRWVSRQPRVAKSAATTAAAPAP